MWNLLLEVKGLDRGSHEDDLPSGDDVYLTDEALADECDDTPELIDYTPIRPAAPAAVEAPAPASTLTSTPMRDMMMEDHAHDQATARAEPDGVRVLPRRSTRADAQDPGFKYTA